MLQVKPTMLIGLAGVTDLWYILGPIEDWRAMQVKPTVLIGLAGSGVEAPDLPTEPGRGTETVKEIILTWGCSYKTSMGSEVGLFKIVCDCSSCVGTVAALRTPG